MADLVNNLWFDNLTCNWNWELRNDDGELGTGNRKLGAGMGTEECKPDAATGYANWEPLGTIGKPIGN